MPSGAVLASIWQLRWPIRAEYWFSPSLGLAVKTHQESYNKPKWVERDSSDWDPSPYLFLSAVEKGWLLKLCLVFCIKWPGTLALITDEKHLIFEVLVHKLLAFVRSWWKRPNVLLMTVEGCSWFVCVYCQLFLTVFTSYTGARGRSLGKLYLKISHDIWNRGLRRWGQSGGAITISSC